MTHFLWLQSAFLTYCECLTLNFAGLVQSYLAISKVKEALYIAREAMKTMPQSAKALKLVGDVHAKSSSGREKVCVVFCMA